MDDLCDGRLCGHVSKVMFEKKKLGQVILESCKPKKSPARDVPAGTSSSMAQLGQANNATAAKGVVGSSSPTIQIAAMTPKYVNLSFP
jgi:hypothetical protein